MAHTYPAPGAYAATVTAHNAVSELTATTRVTITVDYTWDERGNLRNDGSYTYTWNAAGRLTHTTRGASSHRHRRHPTPLR